MPRDYQEYMIMDETHGELQQRKAQEHRDRFGVNSDTPKDQFGYVSPGTQRLKDKVEDLSATVRSSRNFDQSQTNRNAFKLVSDNDRGGMKGDANDQFHTAADRLKEIQAARKRNAESKK